MGLHALRKRTLKSGRKKGDGRSKADPELYHGARGRHHYFECQQLLLRKQIAVLTKLWSLPSEFEIICRDIWALHLALLPNPPLIEPNHDNQGSTQDKQGGENLNTTAEKNDAVTSESRDADSDKEQRSQGEDDEEGGDDPELAALLQMNSDISSSSDSEIEEPRRQEADGKAKRQKGRYSYEMPASTIAVLIVACWTMRIPIISRDFTRLIETYGLPYLDPVSRKLLPANMVAHLTKHNIQALSPHHAPSTMTLHSLASRLSRKMYSSYGIFTPEANGAPILWRVVSQGLCSTPMLYKLTKRLAHILSLPLTLHHTLAPGLERPKAYAPSRHNYDNVPPEVSLVSAAIMVLKMVYGLDGRPRVPDEPSDPACALPRIDEYLRHVQEQNDVDSKVKAEFFSSQRSMCAGDLQERMMDEYLDFCERALLPETDDENEDSLLKRYFPLSKKPTDVRGEPGKEHDRQLGAMMAERGGLRTGEGYRMYSSGDKYGTLPRDYEVVIGRGARFVGVRVEILNGVVETYERRLQLLHRGNHRFLSSILILNLSANPFLSKTLLSSLPCFVLSDQ